MEQRLQTNARDPRYVKFQGDRMQTFESDDDHLVYRDSVTIGLDVFTDVRDRQRTCGPLCPTCPRGPPERRRASSSPAGLAGLRAKNPRANICSARRSEHGEERKAGNNATVQIKSWKRKVAD
jgi:hypothetical protein